MIDFMATDGDSGLVAPFYVVAMAYFYHEFKTSFPELLDLITQREVLPRKYVK